jgi:hypothetical protein
VRVNIHRSTDFGVPHQLLHDLHILALSDSNEL